jgi:hypothetical protein
MIRTLTILLLLLVVGCVPLSEATPTGTVDPDNEFTYITPIPTPRVTQGPVVACVYESGVRVRLHTVGEPGSGRIIGQVYPGTCARVIELSPGAQGLMWYYLEGLGWSAADYWVISNPIELVTPNFPTPTPETFIP